MLCLVLCHFSHIYPFLWFKCFVGYTVLIHLRQMTHLQQRLLEPKH